MTDIHGKVIYIFAASESNALQARAGLPFHYERWTTA